MKKYLMLALAGLIAMPAIAQTSGATPKQTEVMKKLLAKYEAKAKEELLDKSGKATGSFTPFSAEVGREFYLKRRTWQSHDYTCSGCHTTDPAKEGKHIDTKKAVKPLAPAANPERFVDAEKVEKNFAEHCMDLYDRDCRPAEKGNFITYLMSVK